MPWELAGCNSEGSRLHLQMNHEGNREYPFPGTAGPEKRKRSCQRAYKNDTDLDIRPKTRKEIKPSLRPSEDNNF